MPDNPTAHPPDTNTPAHDALAVEQAYLARARTELARMREHTLSLESQAGNKVSGEYLAWMLWQRARALIDDPATALFFGRIDTTDGHRHYIGRRHVSDAEGDPVVIDWRAPVSTPFYQASPTEPMGVRRRRRFGIDRGQITAYEDESLADHQGDPTDQPGHSAILAAEIERPRMGPMRDIVATIQPDQDRIVRADLAQSICIQGAPGTGKTAVGLHRAAWLLYSFRDRLIRQGVLVVGPNRAFLDHIGAVLPALGELEVQHATAPGLLASSTGAQVRAEEPVEVALLKGQARMAQVLHRAVWSQVSTADEPLIVPRGSRVWRVPAYEAQDILTELSTRGVRYASARDMLAQRLAHAVLVKMERSGDSPDDRVQSAVARSTPVKAYVKQLWPLLTAPQVLHQLFSDPARLAEAAEGILDSDEQRALLWRQPPRSARSARWSAADLPLLDELSDLIERGERTGHVILDEAQDLSPMHLRAIGRRAETGSMTVLGDIAQGTTPWAAQAWAESLKHLGKPEAHIESLTRGFRVPAAVIEFAAPLLTWMAPNLDPPESVRTNPGLLQVRLQPDLTAGIVAAAGEATGRAGSTGIIVPDALVASIASGLTEAGAAFEDLSLTADSGIRADLATDPDIAPPVQLIPATLTKGLEFDYVIVGEPALIVSQEPDRRSGLRRLYVVLTRAVTSLQVVHTEPLPRELGTYRSG